MKITEPFVLPSDVAISEVDQLPEEMRSQFEYDAGDFILSRPRTRSASQVINKSIADLLTEFRTPKTIVDAIVKYSKDTDQQSEALLEEAYPFIERFINQSILVAADSAEAKGVAASLEVGSHFRDLEIVREVQVILDTEVYEARNASHKPVALKLARPETSVGMKLMLEREALILRHLNGSVSPALISSDQDGDCPFILMEWCPGVNAVNKAQEIKYSASLPEARKQLAHLCLAVAQAYAGLHQQGIIHGDVHPGNILVGDNGAIKIIDFGLARMESAADDHLRNVGRGGVPFYLEPESARAGLENRHQPLTSFQGEQYAVAAVLYGVITGNHYCDFSLDREQMLRQICEDAPLPFYERGMGVWSTAEAVLQRALSKDPAARYESLSDFADAWQQVVEAEEEANLIELAPRASNQPSALSRLLDQTLEHIGLDGKWLRSGISTAPTASVNYGAAGIAYALYRIGCAIAKPSLLTLAQVWLSQAYEAADNPVAFENPALEIKAELIGKVSPYHTLSGLYATQAFVSHAVGDIQTLWQAIERYVESVSQPCDNLDLTLGRSSTLLTSALLLDMVGVHRGIADVSSLKAYGQKTLTEIWAQLDLLEPISECVTINYLGIAHGWAGLCYATMRWCQVAGEALPVHVEERLQQLASLAEPVGRGIRWKWMVESSPVKNRNNYMPGWCNGSAGHVHLWTLAYEQFKDNAYLSLAERVAWNTFEDHASLGNLCCGVAGQAYGLLNLYKLTQDGAWLKRARELGELAATITLQSDLRFGSFANEIPAHSLYKGQLGVAILAAEMERPEFAAMPFFERETNI